MTVRYDSRDPSAVRKAAIVCALDVAEQVTFVDTGTGKGQAEKTVHLIDPDGREVTGVELFRTALNELVLLRPRPIRYFGYIPGVWSLVNAWFGR